MVFGMYITMSLFVVLTVVASAEPDVYVVHMDKAKMKTLDASLGASKRWYDFVIESITEFSSSTDDQEGEQERQKSSLELLYVYETAISGFAAALSTNQLQSLKRIDGFLSGTKDELLSLHTTHTPHFLGLKIGRGLWKKASNMASDVIIGVVDTGIWPEHVSFQDSGMPPVPSRWKGKCEAGTNFSSSNCNKKLIGARVFFKGYEAIAGRINETLEYKSPRDSEGHGTHTASTAAGNNVKNANFFGLAKGSASGMSYTSRIAAYKTCYLLGCASSDILAAINQAVSDGVDVLSLSLGGASSPYYIDNMAIASFGAAANGVFVSSSAGNSGPTSSTVGNTAPWMTTVAASYIDRSFPSRVKLGDGKVLNGASLYYGKPTKQLPLVYGGNAGGLGAQYCFSGSLSPKLVNGKIVICERGINSRVGKGEQVKLAGGAGMLLVNSQTEGEELFADPHILPATMLGAKAADYIKSYLNMKAANATASIAFSGTLYGNPAPVVAAFSSRGPNSVGPDILKPDVTGPGVNILAAWPPNLSPTRLNSDKRSVLFNIVSGTSMSCPHVSGVAALLKSVHKDWSPAAIKSALMTTAYTFDNRKAPIADASSGGSKIATPFAFGSGHIDPERAADPGLVYDISTEDYLNYLCSLNYGPSQLALFSTNNFTCPVNASALQPGDLNYPSFAVLLKKDSQKNVSAISYKRTVTNVGIRKSTYVARIAQPGGVSVQVEPAVLDFERLGQKLWYKISFTKLEDRNGPDNHSFGSVSWVSTKHTVTSPISVTWK